MRVKSDKPLTCYHCGKPIEGKPHVDSGEVFCNEECVDKEIDQWSRKLR